jgi:tetratricopeptide (TPR) repeat protein
MSLAIRRSVEPHAQGKLGQAENLYAAKPTARPDNFDACLQLGMVRLQQGRYAEAFDALGAALSARPSDVAALSNFGVACAALGRSPEALASYNKALSLKPDLADTLINLGNLLLGLGRTAEALESYDRALACNPCLTEALNNRGGALLAFGRPAEALASFDEAIVLRPSFAFAHNNRGNALLGLKRPAEALASYDEAIALKPDFADALDNRSAVLSDLKRPTEALASCDRALALRPGNAQSFSNRGNVLVDLRRPLEAVASYDRALAIKPDYVAALNNRAIALVALKRPLEALTSYDRAVAIKPDYAEAHDNRGVLLAALGRFGEAKDAAETAIRIAPNRPRAYYNLTLVTRMATGDRHLRAMEDLARNAPSLTANEQRDLNFALAKAYADIGDHERAFRRLADGAALKRRSTVYDEAAAHRFFQHIEKTFTGELLRRHQGSGALSNAPVFIIGMPRSGTTLIEQILASHPKVGAAGEIDDFQESIRALEQAPGNRGRFPEMFSDTSGEQLRRLGAHYLQRIGATSSAALRITDKMPENFLFAGLIRLALPNARIIHVRRDPIDTCFSCFSQLFIKDQSAPYSYDLGELGRRYRAYERLMTHWRAVLPQEAMLEVRYEDVVFDLEGQARRILAHCGLDWDARCLDFHRTERWVATASMSQVRQPLYQSSVGRWRAYAPFLGPLLSALGVSV